MNKPLDFISAIKVSTDVFDQYKVDQWKWWKRMDGTPILNDVAVRMANAFLEAFESSPLLPQQGGGTTGMPWDLFPGWLIDHCEGDIVSEEGLQSALADMLNDLESKGKYVRPPESDEDDEAEVPRKLVSDETIAELRAIDSSAAVLPQVGEAKAVAKAIPLGFSCKNRFDRPTSPTSSCSQFCGNTDTCLQASPETVGLFSKKLPETYGHYWHWNGGADSVPRLESVQINGSHGAAINRGPGSGGFAHYDYCEVIGGYWLKIIPPSPAAPVAQALPLNTKDIALSTPNAAMPVAAEEPTP